MRHIDETHDPQRRSWIASANGDTDFPIQNLPFGVFRPTGAAAAPRIGVAIGDQVLDLTRCRERGLFEGLPSDVSEAASGMSLNALAALGPRAMSLVRRRLVGILDEDGWGAEPATVVPTADVALLLPAVIGDYTDFYTSLHHATNVGHLFRTGDPLFPNFKHLPVGYHGRSSSIVPNGTPVRRPHGQRRASAAEGPTMEPSARLDYEMEIGAFVGRGNAWTEPIAMTDAEDHLLGLCLLNDWSARDIQAWESQPLGPFLAKSFATSISPWVVTLEALAPFRCPAAPRAAGDPGVLRYLQSDTNDTAGGFEIVCEVHLTSAAMRDAGHAPFRVSRHAFSGMYWTFAQMVTHHSSNGCNLRPGDLIGSGTVSGPTPDSLGCLLEMTRDRPIALPSGEERTFLADGDEVILRARCVRDGCVSIGFGECRGLVVPAAG